MIKKTIQFESSVTRYWKSAIFQASYSAKKMWRKRKNEKVIAPSVRVSHLQLVNKFICIATNSAMQFNK